MRCLLPFRYFLNGLLLDLFQRSRQISKIVRR